MNEGTRERVGDRRRRAAGSRPRDRDRQPRPSARAPCRPSIRSRTAPACASPRRSTTRRPVARSRRSASRPTSSSSPPSAGSARRPRRRRVDATSQASRASAISSGHFAHGQDSRSHDEPAKPADGDSTGKRVERRKTDAAAEARRASSRARVEVLKSWTYFEHLRGQRATGAAPSHRHPRAQPRARRRRAPPRRRRHARAAARRRARPPRVYGVGELLAGRCGPLLEERVGRVWVVGRDQQPAPRRLGPRLLHAEGRARPAARGAVPRRRAAGCAFEPRGRARGRRLRRGHGLRRARRSPARVREIEPRGVGALQLAFEQLRRRLEAEGLFDAGAQARAAARCRGASGVVTSPSRRRAARRARGDRRGAFRRSRILISPAPRAGRAAPSSRSPRRSMRSRAPADVDVVLLVRGGGSLEDLWAFNSEVVARAIARSRGAGRDRRGARDRRHDRRPRRRCSRAPTPSAAAELGDCRIARALLGLARARPRGALGAAMAASTRARRGSRSRRERDALRAARAGAQLRARRERLGAAARAAGARAIAGRLERAARRVVELGGDGSTRSRRSRCSRAATRSCVARATARSCAARATSRPASASTLRVAEAELEARVTRCARCARPEPPLRTRELRRAFCVDAPECRR